MRRLGKANATGPSHDPHGTRIQVNYILAEGGKAVGTAAGLIAPGEIGFQIVLHTHRHSPPPTVP